MICALVAAYQVQICLEPCRIGGIALNMDEEHRYVVETALLTKPHFPNCVNSNLSGQQSQWVVISTTTTIGALKNLRACRISSCR